MRTVDVISHFGSKSAAARALGIGKAAVSKWSELVPPLQAARLDDLTRGALKFDLADYRDWNRPSKEPSQALATRVPDAA